MLSRLMVCVIMSGVSSVAVCLAQAPDERLVLSLAQCEELAVENSMMVRQASVGLELAHIEKSRASHARYLPEFTLRNTWGVVPRARGVFTETGVLTSPDTAAGFSDLRPFTQVDMDLVQPIWTFGKLQGLNDAAAHRVEAGEANLDAKKAEVLLKVRELYWGVVLGYELLSVVRDAVDEIARAEEKLQEKLDEGSDEVSQNDVFKLQLFKYEISKQHREALDKIEVGRSALRAALGLQPTVEVDVENRQLEPLVVAVDSLPVYLDMALSYRPELAQLRAGINARSALVTVSKSEYLPQFFFGAQLKFNYAKDRFDSNNPFVYNPTNFFRRGAVLGFNWNLNFWQSRDRVHLAELERERLLQEEPALVGGIRLDVERAYREFKRAEADLEEGRTALTASDNWLRSEGQTFDIGIGEVKDFIDAFRTNGAMKAEQLRNVFDFNTSLARLSKAVGRDLYPVDDTPRER